MKVTVRLYRQHDLDLISLYKNGSISLSKTIQKALTAYVRNEAFCIAAPDIKDTATQKHKQKQLRIYLNEKTEKDVIKWLVTISLGYRNSAIKNIVRYYLDMPAIAAYYLPDIDPVEVKTMKRLSDSQIKNTKSNKEILTGEQMAEKILKTPVNEINKKTVSATTKKCMKKPKAIIHPETKIKEIELAVTQNTAVETAISDEESINAMNMFDQMMEAFE